MADKKGTRTRMGEREGMRERKSVEPAEGQNERAPLPTRLLRNFTNRDCTLLKGNKLPSCVSRLSLSVAIITEVWGIAFTEQSLNICKFLRLLKEKGQAC